MLRSAFQSPASAPCRVALVACLFSGTAAAAPLHLELVRSAPADGAVLTAPPSEIRLWFSEGPQAAGTSIHLLRADSTQVKLSDARPDTLDSKILTSAVLDELPAGPYTVAWRAMSADGHVVRGRFQFAVRTVEGRERAAMAE